MITCLREIIEKYITFLVPFEKEVTRIDEKGKEIKKTPYLTDYNL